MKTTLNAIQQYVLCKQAWEKLLGELGKTQADNEPLSLLLVFECIGLHDTLRCLQSIEGYDKEIKLFSVWCARQAEHLMTDPRSTNAIDVAERYANGKATYDDLKKAYYDAWDAVEDSKDVSRLAAKAAAWCAKLESAYPAFISSVFAAYALSVTEDGKISCEGRDAQMKEFRRILSEIENSK